MRAGGIAIIVGVLLAACAWPVGARVQLAEPKPGQGAPAPKRQTAPTVPATDPEQIVPDDQFEKSVPKIDGGLDAPLAPIEATDAITPPAPAAGELATPLPPIATFDATPVQVEGVDDPKAIALKYETRIEGLDAIGLKARFLSLSALKKDNDAPNAAIVSARAHEDEALAVRLMKSLGYYDGTAASAIEQLPGNPGRVRAIVTAVPGKQYTLGSIAVKAAPTVPPQLVERELPLKVGDPVEAERIQAAEANVAVKLPQLGYAFAKVGERDILLDDDTVSGDYTLPVEVGPRGSFGNIVTKGDPVFTVEHIDVLRRYDSGQLYDSRKVDDLRQALVATSLFQSIAVEPQATGRPGPDGTEAVDLLVTQNKGPARSLAATAGYSTGQGFRAEASWTHRNLFPPEGALILAGIGGTQEQALSATFRRSNAGKRDRTFSAVASVNHSNYAAFEAFTGTLAARIAYDSTPIWQKRFTYAFGAELTGSNEDRYDFALRRRERGTYFIAALPAQAQFDTSDSLLNPTRGFRVKASVSPETSVRGGVSPYARILLEGSAYYPVSDSFVVAGRLRAGTIPGTSRDDLPPSRRYYAGGGGSVRGFGYQQLGPRDPNNDPVGGRSLNEAAFEVRYRFGNFGIVPFVDAGQVYEGIAPTGSDLRFGAGIGGRFYTNFGPFRVDVATPIARKPGESKVALYLSIGQAF